MDRERSESVASTVHYHSPSVVCFVLLSFSRCVSNVSSSLLLYPFLSCARVVALLLAPLLSGSGHLKSSSVSTIQLLSGHQHPLHLHPNHPLNVYLFVILPTSLRGTCLIPLVPTLRCRSYPAPFALPFFIFWLFLPWQPDNCWGIRS